MQTIDAVYESRERVISTAIELECQLAQVTSIHAPLEVGLGTENYRTFCAECGGPYPCRTAVAAGVIVLDNHPEGME